MFVRDPHGMSVCSHPADRIPEGVECTIEQATATQTAAESSSSSPPPQSSTNDTHTSTNATARIFTYSPPSSSTAKFKIRHVFTCNRPALQALPNEWFRDVQLNVPMGWQQSSTKLAAGP